MGIEIAETVTTGPRSYARMPRRDCWRSRALIILFIVFSLASPNFLQFNNIVGILLATAVNGVLALGVTFVIITGGIDLSIGTVMTFSAVMTGVFITFWACRCRSACWLAWQPAGWRA